MKTAGEVNAAILESFSQGKESKLVALLKLLCWGESMLVGGSRPYWATGTDHVIVLQEERADFPKVCTW